MTEADFLLSEHERQKCEVWTRCMGYFRPISQFNIGKKSEFKERKWFKEEKALERIKEEKIAV